MVGVVGCGVGESAVRGGEEQGVEKEEVAVFVMAQVVAVVVQVV